MYIYIYFDIETVVGQLLLETKKWSFRVSKAYRQNKINHNKKF